MRGDGTRTGTDRLRKPWTRSERVIPRRVVRPLERYLQLEAGSASLLMAAAVLAFVWVNLDEASYERLWSTLVVVDVGPIEIEEDLRHIVNDLLMAVFFYVVALEIKREMLFGALRDRRSAVVPAAAALGTMVGGALAYVAVNLIADGNLRGWAIPAATDIAFALGVLGLAGRRAPRELRAFLLTLAVVDDLATIAIIGLFFSSGISLWWLAAAVGITGSVVLAQRIGVRSLLLYVILAGALWYAVLESGIHATIAGVVLGFLTPAIAFQSRRAVADVLQEELGQVADGDHDGTEATLLHVSKLTEEAVSPLARMEERLHPWSAYAVLPLFALANAGVPVSVDAVGDAFSSPVGLGIALGLVVGAPIGGILFALGVVHGARARLPDGLDWGAVVAVTPLKGIGFTVAIFISTLALDDPALLDQAKLAILGGSLLSGIIGLSALILRARSSPGRDSGHTDRSEP